MQNLQLQHHTGATLISNIELAPKTLHTKAQNLAREPLTKTGLGIA